MTRSILVLLLASACGQARYRHVEVDVRPLPAPVARVAVAPAVLLQEVPDAVEEDPFRDGVYVGNLVFSGGLVTEQQEVGLQNISKQVDREAVDLYSAQVRDVTDRLVADALDGRKLSWTRLEPLDPATLQAPRRLRERGTYADMGHDNLNLPRFDLEPRPLEEAIAAVPEGHDALLVPWVVHYYSHNAGWFVGQTWGCAAGARYRVVFATYDAETGAPIGWTDLSARYLHDRIFQPNSGQLEDFVMDVEQLLARKARKQLLR